MNVTIVCQGFDRSSILLQPWRRVYEISRRMTARGIHVVIVSDGSSSQAQTEEICGIQVNRINNLVMAPFVNKKKLTEVIMKNKPDVIFWYGTPFSAFYLNQLKSLVHPLIWDIDTDLHNLSILSRVSIRELFHPHHNFLLNPLLTAICPRFIIRITANSTLVSGIVVPSQYLKDSLVIVGVDPHKIAIIPSTIETDSDDYFEVDGGKEELRRKLGFRSGEFIAVYYGSPCSLRGPDTAILSMPEILRKRGNVRLVILSRKEKSDSNLAARKSEIEENYLKSLVKKLRLENHVEIISGILDRADLMEYLKAADVIVLPFKIVFSEPPLSVLETMKLGKTVISTNLKILHEILREDRGVLVEPSRPKDLAKVILFLAGHPKEAGRYSRNAFEYAKNLPDWDKVADLFISLLKEVQDMTRE